MIILSFILISFYLNKLISFKCNLNITKSYINFLLNRFNQIILISSLILFCNYFYNLNSFVHLIPFIYLLEWFVILVTYLYIKQLGFRMFFLINIVSSISFFLILLTQFINFNYWNSKIFWNIGVIYKQSYHMFNSINLFLDYINYNFCLLTTLISLIIYIYIYLYFKYDLYIINFYFFLKLFVLSMCLLLMSNTFLSLLLGWELIGITSFLLINFWTNRISTLRSALKAFIFNKVSDNFILIVFFILQIYFIMYFNTLNLNTYLYLFKYIYIFNICIPLNEVILGCLCISAFCKSAQFGFHFWLPDSMEAPIPASALIHSSTLVSAGIYLMLRFNYLFNFSTHIYYLYIVLTIFTCFFGAFIATFQTDLKKILAYSTISHCGFLMVSICLFNPLLTLLYLTGHGLYKAISFVCVGSFLHFNKNYQDSRKFGMLAWYSNVEYYVFIISILNLSSLPFMINFFIKHYLLTNVFLYNWLIILLWVWIITASYLGIFYSIKTIYHVFYNLKKNNYKVYSLTYISKNYLMFTYKSTLYLLMLVLFFTLNLFISLILWNLYQHNWVFVDFTYIFLTHLNWIFYFNILFIYLFILIISIYLSFKKNTYHYYYWYLLYFLIKVFI